MDFYRKMIIKILEASETGREARVLKILKSGYDLTQKERRELEELIDSIIVTAQALKK
mgnify:CR=1 FL=1